MITQSNHHSIPSPTRKIVPLGDQMASDELLPYLIRLLTFNLEELTESDPKNKNAFIYGEKTAYVECLEILQYWQHAEEYGLNYFVEDRFPIAKKLPRELRQKSKR